MSTSLAISSLGSARLMRTYNPTSGEVDLRTVGGGDCRWIVVVGVRDRCGDRHRWR